MHNTSKAALALAAALGNLGSTAGGAAIINGGFAHAVDYLQPPLFGSAQPQPGGDNKRRRARVKARRKAQRQARREQRGR